MFKANDAGSTCVCAIVKTVLLTNLFTTDPDRTCTFLLLEALRAGPD